MKRLAIFLCFVALLMVMAWTTRPSAGDPGGLNEEAKILRFQTMVGVQPPYTGATNAIRGVPGAGAPWDIADAKGELRTDGEIDIKVRGLVLTRTGANPVPNFRAIVSCLSTDADGQPVT